MMALELGILCLSYYGNMMPCILPLYIFVPFLVIKGEGRQYREASCLQIPLHLYSFMKNITNNNINILNVIIKLKISPSHIGRPQLFFGNEPHIWYTGS